MYYSSTGFIDYDSFNIEFDESRLPEFETPTKIVPTEFNVTIDSQGEPNDTASLNAKFGEPYGSLPMLTKKGYTLSHWTCDGRIVDENSVVLSTKPVEASWKLITSGTISINKTLEVSSSYKFNPLDYFIPGNNGETSGNDLSINDMFDFDALKKEGYKLYITVDCDARYNDLAVFGLKYNINFHSNKSDYIIKRNVFRKMNRLFAIKIY